MYVAIIPYFYTILKTNFQTFMYLTQIGQLFQKKKCKYYGFQTEKCVSTSMFLC